jgi:RND family efflux transporter MFP subunit
MARVVIIDASSQRSGLRNAGVLCPRSRRGAIVLAGALLLLPVGCGKQNTYVAPPPAEVGVAVPLQQTVKAYLEQTGNTVAFAKVDLVARVEGFLTDIRYDDGALAKKDQVLFVIEQPPYQARVQEAEAALGAAKAQLVRSQAEFDRQKLLMQRDVTAQVMFDKAMAQRDTDQSAVTSAEASLTIARLNLDYTRVTAPFDGIVTKHLVSVGELVGETTKTKLASVVQLDPIYVTFNVSEQDLLKIRHNIGERRLNVKDLSEFSLEVGLMTEEGFHHKGTVDYVSPEIDAATGTILVRGIFSNPDRALLPGFFVRIRVPSGRTDENALLVPDRVIGMNQAGHFLLVLNNDNVVEQRKVQAGQQFGDLRVIEQGLKPDDRVVITGIERVIPGNKVAPQQTVIAASN